MPDKLLLEKLKQYWYKPLNELQPSIQLVVSQKEKWQTLIPLLEQISTQNAVFIMIYNTILKRFVYVVDKRKVTGYETDLYLAENGYEFSMHKMHPDYLQPLLLSQVESFNFLISNLNSQLQKIVCNLEGVYKKNSGQYFHFLQQSMCLEIDDKGLPVILLSYVHDITYLKKNNTANLVITTPDEIKWWNFNFDKNCLEPVQPLSKQEKKILLLLSEGKSSKEIANELSISNHTVDTHRRHLLEKTNCTDTTGMITYARLVGLI